MRGERWFFYDNGLIGKSELFKPCQDKKHFFSNFTWIKKSALKQTQPLTLWFYNAFLNYKGVI